MKILYLINIISPDYAKHYKLDSNFYGGWITSTINQLKKEENIELVVCFPDNTINYVREVLINNVKYIGFPKKKYNPYIYDKNLKFLFSNIIKKEQPNLVHIFGTEFSHTLSMCEAFNSPSKTLINIQGICNAIYLHYLDGLSCSTQNAITFIELLRKNSLKEQKKHFFQQAKNEIASLNKVENIIGRTEYDYAWIKKINPNINYYHCNETLRPIFYEHSWKYESCIKHSIFISQAGYPIKGLHIFLEALVIVIKRYPDCKVKIAGPNILENKIKFFSKSSYYKYLINFLDKNDLRKNVEFLGNISDEEMLNEYIKSNLFVIPSMCENSPNSLGEAMLLGVPCVCSDVGGISELIRHNEEGFVYQSNDSTMLAHYITKMFQLENSVVKYTIKARNHASQIYNQKSNLSNLISIYKKILSK